MTNADDARFAALYDPILEEIQRRSAITERFLDTEAYRILLATVWANVVVAPEEGDLTAEDLEPFHDYLNQRASEVLGEDDGIRESFRFLRSAQGEAACARTRIPAGHRALLARIGRAILDPHGIEARLRGD